MTASESERISKNGLTDSARINLTWISINSYIQIRKKNAPAPIHTKKM